MRKIFWQIFVSILGFFLIKELVPGVFIHVIPGQSNYLGINFNQDWQILIFIGIVFGLISFFLMPFLELVTLPLKIFGRTISSIILNMFLLWGLAQNFPEIKFEGRFSIFWSAIILFLVNTILKTK